MTQEQQATKIYLRGAIAAEITAYYYSDPAFASMFYGNALQSIQNQIQDLNVKGVYLEILFDENNSYIQNIRVPQTNRMEVDFCGYWTNNYHDRLTSNLITPGAWTLIPQTIVIENLNNNSYITDFVSYTGKAFCT